MKLHPRNPKRQYRILLLFVCMLLTFSGCSKKEQLPQNDIVTVQKPISKSTLKLNTAITITLYDSNDVSIIDGCFELCDYYENLFSRTLTTSEIYQLNSAGTAPFKVSSETLDIISKGLEYGDFSDGAFDISIAPLSTLWNFSSSSPKRPSDDAIATAVAHVNYKNVEVANQMVTFKQNGMGIDLGGIAKGYIADRIKDYLISQGVKSATINLGGNVLCVGNKPNDVPFNIGIQKPYADRSETIAVMQLSDVSVVSSGIYERFFTEDGINYHHILDPKTGLPVNNDLISVTIVSPYSVDGDALSTICFAKGLKEGMELINSLDDTYAVFITDDYELHFSDGFLDNIPLVE